jgi:C7-cyclitol 7-kinase
VRADNNRRALRGQALDDPGSDRCSDVLTFDLGGTYMRAALYDPVKDQLSSVRRRLSPNFLTRSDPRRIPEEVIGALVDLGSELLAGHKATIISLSFPAPMDVAGNALALPTLAGPDTGLGFPVASVAAARWQEARVCVLNDLTAAGFRYAPELRDFCILTIGSGIGHKVFVGGVPQVGRGHGGEIGHLRLDYDPDALPCDCGGHGHLGGIASGRGAVRFAIRCAATDGNAFRKSLAGELSGGSPNHIDSTVLVQAFRSGDPWTRRVVRDTAQRMGQALAAIYLDVGVETFIIIGGFGMALGEDYRLILAECARESCWDLGQDWASMLQFGAPDDNHALIGGARYAARASGDFMRGPVGRYA